MFPSLRPLLCAASLVALSTAQTGMDSTNQNTTSTVLLQDPLGAYPPVTQGQPIEVVHLYYDGYPTAIAVQGSSGRKWSTFPPPYQAGLLSYTVAELNSNNTETPYPNAEINIPPEGRVNTTTNPPTGANTPDYLVAVQAVYLDSIDRLWILDTGRPDYNGSMVMSAPGGPKLVAVNITTNTVIQTIVFDATIAYPDSYPNDVRLDLRPSSTPSGQGIAYITDSSTSGRNGIIVVDLGTGEQWRHLDNTPFVRPEVGFLPVVWGEPIYSNTGTMPISFQSSGSDSIQISADGATLYFRPLASYSLYSIPTANLRQNGNYSELLCQGSVSQHGQTGFTDGMEADSNGLLYFGNNAASAIQTFDPTTGLLSVLTRDPRLSWMDTLSVANDGYLYFTQNQMQLLASMQGGTTRTQKPYALFRTALVNNATRISLV